MLNKLLLEQRILNWAVPIFVLISSLEKQRVIPVYADKNNNRMINTF